MENMPIKKLAERSTFSCNQKFDKFLEKKISIWPLQFCNAIGSKSFGIRMYIFFTKRKYDVNSRCTCEVWENKVLHEFMTPSWRDLNWIKILVTTSHFRGKGETSYFLLNSVVNCEKNDNKHSLIRSVKNEFLDKFQAKRLLMQSRR